jgi:hypothetical protein
MSVKNISLHFRPRKDQPNLKNKISVLLRKKRDLKDIHCVGGRYKYNRDSGVFTGFCNALMAKHQEIPVEPLKKYIWTRTHLRVKHINKTLKEDQQVSSHSVAEVGFAEPGEFGRGRRGGVCIA